jgi:hypothetical protein
MASRFGGNRSQYRNGPVKFAAVAVGYVIAFVIADAALAVRLVNTGGPAAQASAGMYAFGDGCLFLAVFGAVALLPTGMAFFFLRPYRPFWTLLWIGALVLASTGFTATSVYVVAAHWAPRGSPLQFCAALAVLRMLPAPLIATVLLLAGLIAPFRTPRWGLLAAAGVEGAVAGYAWLHWFAGCCFI